MNKERILAVDDDRFFRDLYSDMLSSEGFVVKTAADGMVASVMVRDEAFDIVIVDMVMPEWDGIRTMEEIRKIRPDQDIIMVTHVSEFETAVEAMKAGASDYILKPLSREDLLYAIRRLTKRHRILDEHSKLSAENVEFFEILSTYKKCLKILSITDFDVLAGAVAEVMVSETGAPSGFFWYTEDAERVKWEIIASTVGSEGKRGKALPLGDRDWSKQLSAGTPFKHASAKGEAIYVPLLMQERRLGIVELSGGKPGRRFDERQIKFAGIISEFAQTALNNAMTRRVMTERSLLNDDYGIYSYRFFSDTMQKQLFVSRRYNRPLSVACLKVDNLEALRKDFGAEAVRKGIRGIVEKTLGVIRHSDILAFRSEGEFYILFPETDYFGSIMAVKRIEEAVAGIRYVSDGQKSGSADLLLSSATFPRDGEGIEELLAALSERAAELKNNLFHQLDLTEKELWESVEALLDNSGRLPAPPEGIDMHRFSSPYYYAPFDPLLYDKARNLFIEEIAARPYLRGIFFMGVDKVSPDDPLCRKLGAQENLAMRVFVVGRKGEKPWDLPNVTPVYLKEGEPPVRIALFINEEAGYLFLGREKGQSVHTADLYTVEKMISKMRDHYMLQWI